MTAEVTDYLSKAARLEQQYTLPTPPELVAQREVQTAKPALSAPDPFAATFTPPRAPGAINFGELSARVQPRSSVDPNTGSLAMLHQMLNESVAKSLGQIAQPAGLSVQIDHSEGVTPVAANMVKTATQYLGTPYVWGGTTPQGFDCSGFVQYLYGQQGVQIPRTTYEQWKVGQPVGNIDELEVGDLVFFNMGSRGPEHEGLYIGNGQFIQAPHTGDVVKISSLRDGYYSKQFVGGRHINPTNVRAA